MESHALLLVNDFSKIARTTTSTLRYYDNIGLLRPAVRGENGYRYYSIRQLDICNTIRVLQKLGVPLSEIKELLKRRTPELAEKVLSDQIEHLNNEMNRLKEAYGLLDTMLESIRSTSDADPVTITIQYLPSDPMMLGEPNDYSNDQTDYDALLVFYQNMYKKHHLSEYEVCYPVWGIFTKEQVEKRLACYPARYYFHTPHGQEKRPAGFYAVGYAQTDYGGGDTLYNRMLNYIEQNGFELSGDSYEEYPLNELCVLNKSNYLMRVLMTVRKKED